LPDFDLVPFGCTHIYIYEGQSGSAEQIAGRLLSEAIAEDGGTIEVSGTYAVGSLSGSISRDIYVYFGTVSNPRKHFFESITDGVERYKTVTIGTYVEIISYTAASYNWTPPSGLDYGISLLDNTDQVGTQRLRISWRPWVMSQGQRETGTYKIYRATSAAGANLQLLHNGVVVGSSSDPITFITTEAQYPCQNVSGQSYYLLFEKI